MRKALRLYVLNGILLWVASGVLAQEVTPERPDDWDERLRRLRSTPYVAFSQVPVDERRSGVLFQIPDKICEGYNFYCTVWSGLVYLLDNNGHVAHRWTYAPRGKTSGEDLAIFLENGDLIVLKTDTELLRLNWDSEVIWQKSLRAHHDVTQALDGSFYGIVKTGLRDYRGHQVIFDAVVHLSAYGEEIDRWSTYDHLDELKGSLNRRSFMDTILDSILADRSTENEDWTGVHEGGRPYLGAAVDYFHMNTVGVLPPIALGEKDTRFRPGNLLVCFRNVNQIAILEQESYKILWVWGEGELQWPHHPTMLENGHILIFDNGVERKCSRVVELDPVTESIVWQYTAEPPESFYTYTRGSAQRLPNGNTLICESDEGHVFEVTQEGELVWVWLNQAFKKGPQSRTRESVYRMLRLPSDKVEKLLNRQLWWLW